LTRAITCACKVSRLSYIKRDNNHTRLNLPPTVVNIAQKIAKSGPNE